MTGPTALVICLTGVDAAFATDNVDDMMRVGDATRVALQLEVEDVGLNGR